MSRLARYARLMHSSGRQIPNPGQGGAPDIGTISTTPHSTLPSNQAISNSENFDLSELDNQLPANPSSSSTSTSSASSLTKKYTAKGKLIPIRPPHLTPITLPSGYPEPTTYPPPSTYFDNLESNKRDPHPLWQFFHSPQESKEAPTKDTALIDGGSLEALAVDDANLKSGRSWTAAELREKSFKDLHTLWYILLRERNVLATQREERRRLGLNSNEGGDLITKRAFRCRKSMARIKYVLNERRLGLLAASSPLLKSTSDKGTGESGETDEAVVSDEEVAKEEVGSRDEGFGGGAEAKDFVDEVIVKDGHVQKKE